MFPVAPPRPPPSSSAEEVRRATDRERGERPVAGTTEDRSAKKPRRASRFSTPVDDEELEFIRAIERYKRVNHRPFPSWSEVLGVLKGLGYRRSV